MRRVASWEGRGRGLALLDATDDHWGAVPEGAGKRVFWQYGSGGAPQPGD
jgi:hypothetical protein